MRQVRGECWNPCYASQVQARCSKKQLFLIGLYRFLYLWLRVLLSFVNILFYLEEIFLTGNTGPGVRQISWLVNREGDVLWPWNIDGEFPSWLAFYITILTWGKNLTIYRTGLAGFFHRRSYWWTGSTSSKTCLYYSFEPISHPDFLQFDQL